MSLLSVLNVDAHSHRSKIVSSCLLAVLLSACTTTSEPEPVSAPQKIETLQVEIYEPEPVSEPEPVPSITIEEYERLQREAEAADEAILAAEAEAEAEAKAEVEKAEKAAARRARLAAEQAAKSPLERAADTEDPDEKIALLTDAGDESDVMAARIAAYQAKLVKDQAEGNVPGQADAMIFLADLERAKGSRTAKLEALRQYADVQALDATNAAAPVRISSVRAELQDYADGLHAEAVKLFVAQEFETAIDRWEIVLLIDPGNTAARNWFEQSKAAVSS